MQDAFEAVAVDGVLLAPAAAGLAILCKSSDVYTSADVDIEKYMLAMGKEEGEYWTEADFFVLLPHLGWPDGNSDAAADAAHGLEAQIMALSAAIELFESQPTQVLHTALFRASADVCQRVSMYISISICIYIYRYEHKHAYIYIYLYMLTLYKHRSWHLLLSKALSAPCAADLTLAHRLTCATSHSLRALRNQKEIQTIQRQHQTN